MNWKKFCVILLVTLLSVCMIYSVIHSLFPARYPRFDGEFFIQLDRSYYQIWGDSVHIITLFRELLPEKSEPYTGAYYVLLINTNESPLNSIYNETIPMERSWISQNGSRIYYNNTISVLTTPFNTIVTTGDILKFNLKIDTRENLLLKDYQLSELTNLPKLQLRKGSNNISIEIKIIQGNSPQKTQIFYKNSFEEKEFNLTKQRTFGYHNVFDFSFYKDMTEENKEDLYLNSIEYKVYLLPFSGRILEQQRVWTEDGRMFVSLPLNMSLKANKIAFVRSAFEESYIFDINPATIYLSPPITLPLIIVLILSHELFRKWRSALSHLFKYKIFYICMFIVSILLIFQFSQIFSHISSLFITICITFIGFLSIGVIKNDFSRVKHNLFWKYTVLIMILLPLLSMSNLIYYVFSTGKFETFLPVLLDAYFFMLFFLLGSSLVGMVLAFGISFSAGFFLLISHLVSRTWNNIQNRSKPSNIKINIPIIDNVVLKSLPYYILEIFIFSLWFVILISSSFSVSVEALMETIWENNLLYFLIPISTLTYLLFIYESLFVTWGDKSVGPKVVHKLWSTFTILVFIVKISLEGFGILPTMLFMFLFIMLISSGFAIGFIGISKIALKHALEEIVRIGKRYSEIKIN